MNPTREQVWKMLGAPTEQIGSVNDPRTREEFLDTIAGNFKRSLDS